MTFLTLGGLGVLRRFATHPDRAILLDHDSVLFVFLLGLALMIVLREVAAGIAPSSAEESAGY